LISSFREVLRQTASIAYPSTSHPAFKPRVFTLKNYKDKKLVG